MAKPSNLLLKLSHRLFEDAVERDRFVDVLVNPQPFHPCILWTQSRPADVPFAIVPALSWQPNFVDRLPLGEKPGQTELHQQGWFYCLDFSSVFAASTLLTLASSVNVVFDMCAAPGGKSIFAWRWLQPQLLLSNEVIGKRIGALVSNLKRCHIEPAIVLSVDSKYLAEELAHTANVVLVDAPCTGQSLIAKGDKAEGCFHPVNINKNANRQKRILANAAQLVAPQGYLAYMTCAYSMEENEQVSEWFLQRFPQFQPVTVAHLEAYRSHLTDIPCYRIWPQERLGAGAFSILFHNTETGTQQEISENFWQRPRLKCLGQAPTAFRSYWPESPTR